MQVSKLFEARNLTIYRKLLNTMGDYIGNVPCTGVDALFKILVKEGMKILPKDTHALAILDYILTASKNTPSAIQVLLNTRFACLPTELKPMIKSKDGKYEVAMFTRGKTIYDRVKDLIDWENSKQAGNWTDINGEKAEIIDMSTEEVK
jgi:predicted  nucleic acid-binding Zn ribbon protein